MTADNPLNAVVLSGGSAYGLAASDVMRCLESRIGYDTRIFQNTSCMSVLHFDLGYGRSDIRPDADMGYEACRKAMEGCDVSMGNVGAGTEPA